MEREGKERGREGGRERGESRTGKVSSAATDLH